MIEPISKKKFSAEAKGLNSELNMLMGVALRQKKVVGVNFKVYAVGFYVDPVGARRTLRKFRDYSPAGLKKNQEFYDVVTNAFSFRKVLELSFLRSVGRDKLRDTFNEGLVVRMRALLGSKGDAITEEFISVFEDVKAGQKLIFAMDKGVISVKVHNKAPVKFASSELAHSMLDLYFGKNPTVGEEVKENLIERFPALWIK